MAARSISGGATYQRARRYVILQMLLLVWLWIDLPLLDQSARAQEIQPAPQHSSTLLVDGGDLLEINVFDTPELSGKFRVDGAGTIKLPVGGTLAVKGLTAEQIAAAVELHLREQDIMRDPHATVFVLEYATQGVSVMGEVKAPGIYPLQGRHGVLDLISVAGGLTPFASKTATILHKDSSSEIVSVNLSASRQPTAAVELEVQPGDQVLVARSGVVYVLGDVGKPGGYLIENQERITVLQALALAQGVNKTAQSGAKLIRSNSAGRTEAVLPLKKILANQVADPKLQDGDILYVPMSGARNWTDKTMTAIIQMAVGVVVYGRY